MIWYQGESNRIKASQYANLFPAMIESWRALWNLGNFPFYFVQISPYDYGSSEKTKYATALLREAQLRTMQKVENTGMVVTADIGDCVAGSLFSIAGLPASPFRTDNWAD